MAKKLIIVDSAQIEARILAWLAGQDDLVRGFANGEDVYSEFATELFGVTVRKPRKSDPKMLHDYYEIKRAFGKDSILGFGFGEGATTHYIKCQENDSLVPLFKEPVTHNEKELRKIMMGFTRRLNTTGLDNYTIPKEGEYDEEFIAFLTLRYRNKYTHITDFWGRVEKAFRWVVKYPHETIRVPSDVECTQGSPQLTFYTEDGAVMIQLPSSRCLRYRHPGIDNKKQLRYHWGPLWGGSICLAGYTNVLTDKGWVKLKDIKEGHKVWDGSNWVSHNGLVNKGEQPVIGLNGIDLTEKHKILTSKGWAYAKEAQGLTWAEIRKPESNKKCRLKWKKLDMVGEVPVWERIRITWQGFNSQAWGSFMYALCGTQKGQKRNTRNVEPPGILGLAFYAGQVPTAVSSSMERLWGAWHKSVQTLGGIFHSILGGHESRVCPRTPTGQGGQQWGLRIKKLPVGYLSTAMPKQANKPGGRHTRIVKKDGGRSVNTVLQTQTQHPITTVYDLMDCGHNNCFTVKDEHGNLRLVHNCENIVQSVARDLLGYWILESEKAGIHVALHVHDETISLAEEQEAEKTLSDTIKIMRTGPEWANGLPLNCEGGIADYYGK